MRTLGVGNGKSYERPMLRNLTLNQASLFLVGHAYIGDQGARELLELLFPDPAYPNRSGVGQRENL